MNSLGDPSSFSPSVYIFNGKTLKPMIVVCVCLCTGAHSQKLSGLETMTISKYRKYTNAFTASLFRSIWGLASFISRITIWQSAHSDRCYVNRCEKNCDSDLSYTHLTPTIKVSENKSTPIDFKRCELWERSEIFVDESNSFMWIVC